MEIIEKVGGGHQRVVELSPTSKLEYKSEFLDFSVQWRLQPVDYQLLWKMKYKEGKSNKELAEHFKRKVKTTHWMLQRIRRGEVKI